MSSCSSSVGCVILSSVCTASCTTNLSMAPAGANDRGMPSNKLLSKHFRISFRSRRRFVVGGFFGLLETSSDEEGAFEEGGAFREVGTFKEEGAFEARCVAT